MYFLWNIRAVAGLECVIIIHAEKASNLKYAKETKTIAGSSFFVSIVFRENYSGLKFWTLKSSIFYDSNCRLGE
jgi:hypothetical protein